MPVFSNVFCCRVSTLIPSMTQQPSRNLTYYSVKKGKRKSVRAVKQRFLRLHCGLWVRRKVWGFYCLRSSWATSCDAFKESLKSYISCKNMWPCIVGKLKCRRDLMLVVSGRTQAGYKKKLWKKLPARRKRLREHVFCNKTQSRLLDKMTTSFWKRRNWYLNDPYLKYQDRVNLKP